jgi:diguanylate cyclase (GGDEF)-like protein
MFWLPNDANLYDIQVPLSNIQNTKALSLSDKVIINKVRQDPPKQSCLDSLIQKGIHSILVIPILLYDPEVGSLLLRAVRRESGFTLKEINFFEIATSAAANALERAQLLESVQQANKTLERLAITDGLTGLYNHRYFRERLEEELLRSLRYNLPLSCALFDIDDFKKCNDLYGPFVWRRRIKEIATRMLQTVRRTDIVARYGGEEFIIIMPQTTLEGAYAQAERIRKVIEEKPLHIWENPSK